MSDVTRFHYLKSALTGEAAQLLKNISITNSNFSNAWEKLIARYNNDRALISAQIQSFIDNPYVGSNVIEGLKLLRDSTNESLKALKNLRRPVAEWSDLIVFIVTRKLDNNASPT